MNDPSAAGGEAIDPPPGGIRRLKLLYRRNERRIAVVFFVGGFVFDIVTVDRIDSWFTIGQHRYLQAVTRKLYLETGTEWVKVDQYSTGGARAVPRFSNSPRSRKGFLRLRLG